MFCRYCGELISDDAKFCPGCGEETPAGEFFAAQIPTTQVPVQIQIIQGGTQKTKPPTAVKVLLILIAFGVLMSIFWIVIPITALKGTLKRRLATLGRMNSAIRK